MSTIDDTTGGYDERGDRLDPDPIRDRILRRECDRQRSTGRPFVAYWQDSYFVVQAADRGGTQSLASDLTIDLGECQ